MDKWLIKSVKTKSNNEKNIAEKQPSTSRHASEQQPESSNQQNVTEEQPSTSHTPKGGVIISQNVDVGRVSKKINTSQSNIIVDTNDAEPNDAEPNDAESAPIVDKFLLSLKRKADFVDTPSKRICKFIPAWLTDNEFRGWLNKSNKPDDKHGNEYAFCKVCKSNLVAHKAVLLRHMRTEKHKENFSAVSSNIKIKDMCVKQTCENNLVKRAELKLCSLLATKDLPFLLMDTVCPLLKDIFPDSKIAQQLTVKRTKATQIVVECLGDNFLKELYEKLRVPGMFFSLIMDETTDISVKKQCAFTAIFFDENSNSLQTTFFDILENTGGTAVELYSTLKDIIFSKGIPISNFVGFSSDTPNVMVGPHNSVFSHLKQEFPDIVCVKCSCHMAHLATSKACLKLPKHIEDLLRNIGSHFNRSACRRAKFREFQEFFKVDIHKILSPAKTRWLSLKAVVDRVLEQYEPLRAYFKESVSEDPSHVTETMLETLNHPLTEVYLKFMSYVLELMTDFNILFQSEKPLLYRVKPETENLLKILCSNYMNIVHIKKCAEILKIVHDNPDNFLPLEQIYIGISAFDSLQHLRSDKDTNLEQADFDNFFKSILSFYIELVANIKDRFKFEDRVFTTLELLDPKVAQSFQTKSLKNILDRFPVLNNFVNAQSLDNEWRKHALLDFDSLDINSNTECDIYWSQIFKLKNEANISLFPNLKKVFSLLFVLPFSNAAVERVFSNLFNIKTDKRNLLDTSTIRALLATKDGIGNTGCVKFTPSKKMLGCNIWQNSK
ncbi:uncharacterized protein LOC126883968 [Diabrotica virgifera virgifera]|uniref:HAT C-terminal dimerisation domain-containing protein n=1 Tax=Diabrotica virgifera virgifera TaxID=50390 RepID=A0ABM5K681_DIAVI|nr:uncharacterized protein LOC126883968 [Diabrotica virgifera virgifera]